MYKVFFLIFLSFSTLVADQKLVTENYSAVACYYIPGVHEFDDHPFEPFNKVHLNDSFIPAVKDRLKSLTMTFPQGSSLSLDRKKQTVILTNTAENHAKMRYLVKSYEIAYRGVQVKTILELVEVPDNRKLLELSPAKLTRGAIINTTGSKTVNQFSVLSSNGRSAQASSNFSKLIVTPLIDQQELIGDFDVEWSYEEKGQKPRQMTLKTKFVAVNNQSKVTQVQQLDGPGTRNLYCIFTFVFINNYGEILEPVKNEPAKIPGDEFSVRLYRLVVKEGDEKLLEEDVKSFFPESKMNFPKGNKLVWRPFIKTLVLVNTEKNLQIADKLVPEEFRPEKQVKITAQVIEVQDLSSLKNVKPGFIKYSDLLKVPADKRRCIKSFHCSAASGQNVKMIDTDELVKEESDDEEESDEDIPPVGLFFEMQTLIESDKSISIDFSWMNNRRTDAGIKEQTMEFRYVVTNGHPVVFQIQGKSEANSYQYLVLKAEIAGE